MKTITFECETITPMFMYGADGTTPELRPASIKGVMRFWWRAIHGNLELSELKKKEGEIFGDTEKKSSFSIKVEKYKLNSKKIEENFRFKIDFLISNRCTVDIKSFFELVVILGLFGQKGKGKNKTQGAIKIVKIDNKSYTKTIDLDYIYTLLENFTSNYKKEICKITNKEVIEKYPIVKNITQSNNNLYINFIHSNKIKAIEKNLGAYNNV